MNLVAMFSSSSGKFKIARGFSRLTQRLSPDRLHRHRRAVAQHLGDAGGDFRRIVAHTDDGIRAQLARVREHLVESILAGAFAHGSVERDVAPEYALDARAKISDDGAGTHHDANRWELFATLVAKVGP